MSTIKTQPLQEGVEPLPVTFGIPAALSVVVDNYSNSFLLQEDTGLFIPPRSCRQISLPKQSTYTFAWRAPQGLMNPPPSVPPGAALASYSDQPTLTSLATPITGLPTEQVLFSWTDTGGTGVSPNINPTPGANSIVIINPSSNANSIELFGNQTGTTYGLTPTSQLNTDRYEFRIDTSVDSTYQMICSDVAGALFTFLQVLNYPILPQPLLVLPAGNSMPVSSVDPGGAATLGASVAPTVAGVTLLTIPAGRTWLGTVGCFTGAVAFAKVQTAGAGVKPPAGTILAESQLLTAAGAAIPCVTPGARVTAPAGNPVTLSAQTSVAASSTAWATGALL